MLQRASRIAKRKLLLSAGAILIAASCGKNPSAQSEPIEPSPTGPITLRLKADGVIEFGGELMTPAELKKRLTKMQARRDRTPIFLEIERGADLRHIEGLEKFDLNIGAVGGT